MRILLSVFLLLEPSEHYLKKNKNYLILYRNELRFVRVIGFDELLKRINNMLALFEQ